MSTRTSMFAGVTIWRAVAAARGAALLTGPQMDPTGTNLDALLALAVLCVLDGRDCDDVRTRTFSHDCSLLMIVLTLFVKHLMNECDRRRALTNRRCDTLHVAAADVADRKYARQAGLE